MPPLYAAGARRDKLGRAGGGGGGGPFWQRYKTPFILARVGTLCTFAYARPGCASELRNNAKSPLRHRDNYISIGNNVARVPENTPFSDFAARNREPDFHPSVLSPFIHLRVNIASRQADGFKGARVHRLVVRKLTYVSLKVYTRQAGDTDLHLKEK